MRPISTSSDIKIAASQNIKEKDYWLNKLSGDLVKSHFPYDRPGTADAERRLDTVNFQFSGELSSKLIKLSNKSDNRLHMIVTAGLAALLGKYTGNKDIIIGMPIFKQKVKGEFVNTVLPLRNKLEPGMTFKQLLLQLRETIFEAAEHQNYPMETLLYKLKIPSPGTAGFALFDAAILLENIQDRDYLRGIDYNMLFSLLRTGETIEGKLEYNASLYEKATSVRITGHYLRLLTAALSNPDILLTDIAILPEEEKQRILFDFNNTAVEYPRDKTIHALLEDRVEMAPDKIAVVYKDRYLSYGGLNEKANRLARLLREKGVKQDSIVGIVMEPSLELIVGIVGIIKAGGAYLPIDPDYPERRILSILRDSGASILLTGENILKSMVFTALKGVGEGKAEPVVTQTCSQIKDFDGLPFPDRTLIDYEKYHQYIGIAMAKHTVSLQATRGCPYNCVYCHKIWPKNHVARSAENVFEEIRYCYDAGARRFVFIDDVFNLRKDNLARLMEKIIKNRLDIQIFFPNGLRGDILTREIVDLMVEGGTVNVDLALESASPRIQKLIRKNLDLEKFREIARYFTEKYPWLVLEMELMIGFPTETEEEALMTLDFLKSLKWVHFPNLNILKIYPNTDMYQLAVEQGVSPQLIERSSSQAFHELPHTLPFPKSFAGKFQMDFMNRYFLSRERLLHVLPYQLKILTENELVQKYDSYLPMKIESFSDILETSGISMEDLGCPKFLPQDHMAAPGFREKMREYFPSTGREDENSDAMRVLLLDLSLLFTSESESLLYHMVEEPLGLTYLITYLKKKFGRRIRGKIGKSKVDFDDFDRLKAFILDFNPDIIGIRTLSYYKEFFHKCVTLMRQWGIDIPIIAGGPYATSDYRFVLNDPDIDMVVLGEGELTFTRLIEEMMGNEKKLPGDEVLKDIPGIAFLKEEDKILLEAGGREVVFLDNIEESTAPYPGENLEPVNRPGDLLYLVSTSGSTGVPKSLMIENRNLVNLLNFQFKETPVDFNRVLQFASIGFDVSSQEIFSALLSGGELYLIDGETKGDVYRLLELMGKNQLNVIYWPPAFLTYVFSEPDHRVRFPESVEHIISAGERLVITGPIREYMKESHVYVHNHYGPAETHVVSTFVIDPAGDIPEFPPIGKPISNTRIYILDENKHPIPLGAAGELYIAGANVGRGYHRRKELTAEKFMLDPFVEGEPMRMYRTGDLARWLPDGNLEFLGRADYQVKIRGFRIELAEIEQWLIRMEFIKEAVVVDFLDPNGEKYLCAYVVCPKEVEISEIRDFLADDLPGYMVPSYILRLEKIPLTPNGKVDKKALPLPEFKADKTYAAPGDAVEEELAGIWSEVLGIEKTSISIDANFFELGGHSLKATILITRIHRAFNVKVALAEMFIHPTVRSLAGVIKETSSDIFSAIKPVEKKEFYPLSSAQKRIYLIQRMKADNISYNNPTVLVLEGDLQKENFQRALGVLIKRHESLRTSFKIIDEQVFQEVCENVEFAIEYNEMTEEEAGKKFWDFIRPFDLSRAPLVRVGLVKTGKSRHILMYDLHHIITDGTSMEIFVKEFLALYGGKQLAPLKVWYKDFSEWQNRLYESGKIQKQQDYWLKQFEREVPVLNIPTDYPRPDIQHFEGDAVKFEMETSVTRALNQLAKDHKATLYMVLLAAFNILLHRLSGQEDIVIGTGVAGRRHADLHFIIGMFVGTLVMRNHPNGEKTFNNFLDEVRKRTLEVFENQDYPFEELVEKIVVNRDVSRNPLFDVGFTLQNMSIQSGTIPEVEIPGLHIRPFKYDNDKRGISFSKFDMSLLGIETGPSLTFIIEYSTRLFKKETIERFITYFKQIAGEIVRDADKKISDLEIIPPEEKNRLLVDFNSTGTVYPRDRTIPELFEEQVDKTPGKIAVVGKGERTGKTAQLTYGELNQKANQLGHVLRKKGVKPGSIVGIMMERSMDMIIAMLGILKAGGAYLPIDPAAPRNRIESMLDDTGALILLSENRVVRNHSFTGLQGIRSVKAEQIVTSARPQILDFDGFPIPDRSLVDYEKYNRFIGQAMVKNCISIQATRGCPYNCAYCHKIWPKRHVVRSAENIFAEVELYYGMGVRRFALIDDIFNLNRKESMKFFNLIIRDGLDIQLFFPNGVRADLLTRDYIDLMIKAGTVNIALALESASPRIQALIRKDVNLEKFRENIEYIISKYPHVILELFTMHGFPSETREEAMMTLDFIKSLKWVHFPYVFIVRIYPNTDMEKLAVENGVSIDSIYRSQDLLYHELPDTLPFDKSFTLRYQSDFFNSYFLSKERLLHVLPYQMKVMTEDEIVQKYNSYLPENINNFEELLDFFKIKKEELGAEFDLTEHSFMVPGLNEKIRTCFPAKEPSKNALKILLMDLSQHFSHESDQLKDLIEPPLGLMYLYTHLNRQLGSKVNVKIAKSQVDFDNYTGLKALLDEFKPDVIGIRTLTFFKDFFHKTVSLIRQWGIDVPIITGGPYATSDNTGILQDKNVDLVVLGEGEITFGELIMEIIKNSGKLPPEEVLKEIKGITFISRETGSKKGWGREIIMSDALVDVLSKESTANPDHIGRTMDLAYTVFTSGSTGKPKGVPVTHSNIFPLLYWGFEHLGLSPLDRSVQNLSYFFDWSVWEIFITLLSGASLYMITDEILFNPGVYIDFIIKNNITVLHVTPSQFQYFADNGGRLETLRYLFIGAEKLMYDLVQRSFELVNNECRIFNMYGPTEATIIASVLEIERTGNERFKRLNSIPIGKPVGRTGLLVLDRNFKLCPLTVTGQLYIGGNGVASGYLNRPELTAEKFLAHELHQLHQLFEDNKLHLTLYRTGDLARWLEDGNMEFMGRVDQQVKIRGFRIELGEIEACLLEYDWIKEAVVLMIGEERDEKYLCAYIVPAGERSELPGIGEIRTYLSQSLPEYMIPSYIIPIERIPLNPNGKLDRKALPGAGAAAAQKYAPPENEIQEKLVEMWSVLLERETAHAPVGIDDNFFEIGGHSLRAAMMVSGIRKEWNLDVPLVEVFKSPTIRGLTRYIQPGGDESNTAVDAAGDRRVALLKKGNDSSGHLFLIHDGSGEVEGYIEFCNHLDHRYNCWGIRADGFENYAPGNLSITEIAKNYIEKVKKVQPRGPYRIAAWSLGGTIAFEMVRQLEQMKETVAFFAMIDSPAPDKKQMHGDRFTRESELNWLKNCLPVSDMIEKLRGAQTSEDIWVSIVDYIQANNIDVQVIRGIINRFVGIVIPNYQRLNPGELIRYLNIIRSLDAARASYIPDGKINTPIYFFKTSRSGWPGHENWSEYACKPLKIHEITGDHYSIFKLPGVIDFAEKFGKILEAPYLQL